MKRRRKDVGMNTEVRDLPKSRLRILDCQTAPLRAPNVQQSAVLLLVCLNVIQRESLQIAGWDN